MKYFVIYSTYSRKFNEHYIAHKYVRDLEKFCKKHYVLEAYECEIGKHNHIKTIGKKVI